MDNLIKKLAYLSDNNCPIVSSNWNTYMKICQGVKEKKFKLYSIQTNNTLYNEYKLIELLTENDDPLITRNRIWTTFDGCTRIHVSKFNEELFLRITVYDGRLLDGFPEKTRFEIEIITPMDFIYEMQNLIEDNFEDRMKYEYKDYLWHLEQKWMEQRSDQIMILMELNNQRRKV